MLIWAARIRHGQERSKLGELACCAFSVGSVYEALEPCAETARRSKCQVSHAVLCLSWVYGIAVGYESSPVMFPQGLEVEAVASEIAEATMSTVQRVAALEAEIRCTGTPKKI